MKYRNYKISHPSMNFLKINKSSLKEPIVKTTPQNVQESNEGLFNCTMTLPAAAKHCGVSHKEMKLTFYEYLKYHPTTYKSETA